MTHIILIVFPHILELRHIGTQISSDSHGSIDKSEYITNVVLISMHFLEWFGRLLVTLTYNDGDSRTCNGFVRKDPSCFLSCLDL